MNRVVDAGSAHPAGIASTTRFSPELEGLRGVAILLVFSFHTFMSFHGPGAPTVEALASPLSPLAAFVYSGHTGVTLFFILSAYLLTGPFIAARRAGAHKSPRRFFARRAMRILPAYSVAVIVATVASASQLSDLLRGLPHLFFLDTLGLAEPMIPYSGVWWSLTTEVQFYLVLPLIFIGLRGVSGRILIGLAVAGWALSYAWLIHQPPGGLEQIGHRIHLMLSLYGRGFAFAVGAFAAWLKEVHGEALARFARESCLMRRWAADATLIVLLVGLGLILRRVSRIGFFPSEVIWPSWHIPESLLWGAILLLSTTSSAQVRRLLRSRLLGRIGVLSYSVYLIHLPLLFLVMLPVVERWPGLVGFGIPSYWAVGLACLGLCLGIATLTYRFIEEPFLRRKEKLA